MTPRRQASLTAAVLVSALVGLAGTPFAHAQEGSTLKRPQKRSAGTVDPRESRRPDVSVDFPGGTVAEYVIALKEANGPRINVVVDADAGKVPMPPVSLKNVSVSSSIQLIASTGASREHGVQIETVGLSNRSNRTSTRGAGSSNVFVVSVLKGPGNQSFQNKRLEVFSLKSQEPRVPPETLLTAIDTALGIPDANGNDKALVKYHADSGLLLVHGNSAQLSVVGQVMKAMADTSESQSRADAMDKKIIAWANAMHKKIEKLEERIDKLQAAMERATPKLQNEE